MFVSIIPSIRMPHGHGIFDYQINDGTVHVGDVILVPFRNRRTPGLVARISPTSEYADRAIVLPAPQKILKLPETMAELCLNSAVECFVSPATMLHAWLRIVPKRLPPADEVHTLQRDVNWPKGKSRRELRFVANRFSDPQGIIATVEQEQSNGRILILTPWQRRVDYLVKRLGCQGFHSQTAAGAAWRSWTSYVNQSHGVLVTTRLGAWLSGCADVVIIDEPENDDHKQDELSPRYDARRLVDLAAELNPGMRTINIGTTPPLSFRNQSPAPDIAVDLQVENFVPGSRSNIESIHANSYNEIAQAAEESRPVRILHAVRGDRGRIRCADCGWTANCVSCGSGLNNAGGRAICRKCGKKYPLPDICGACQGTDLSKATIGTDILTKRCQEKFPGADLKVLDLTEWQDQSMPPKSLIVVTNLSLIGGYSEDIRRKERLIISFRRLAAQALSSQCTLVVQTSENLGDECKTWITGQGVQTAWNREWQERKDFQFPPAASMAKLIVPGQPDKAQAVLELVQKICNQATGWSFRGPYPVEWRPQNREPRAIFHLLPPPDATRNQTVDALTPLSAFGILDLDPIAFFS